MPGLTKKCRHVRAGRPPSKCRCAWYGDWYGADGKRVFRNLGPDKAEARARLAQHRADALAGRLTRPSESDTFEVVAQRWYNLSAAGRDQRPCPSSITSIRSPTASRILRNGSRARWMSAAEMSCPPSDRMVGSNIPRKSRQFAHPPGKWAT